MPIKAGADQEPISLGRGNGPQSPREEIPAVTGSPSTGSSVGPDGATVSTDSTSVFFARVLNQLTLSTWLPAAFFTVSVVVLVQFRSAGSVSIRALTLDPIRVLVLMIPLLVITMVVIQAFSFEAIRILEGYWGRRGLVSFARTLMIRRHLHKKEAIIKRRREASEKAFYAAKSRMLRNGIPFPIVNAFEAQVLGVDLPGLTDEERRKFAKMNWRSSCDAWHLARIDHLLNEENAYPVTSRILPTKLGNLIRATEDRLLNTEGDLEGFALRRHAMASHTVQIQHDQFRNRLGMYCYLVLVSASLLILTPIILLGSRIDVTTVAIISGSLAALSAASYLAALATARGYCVTLKQMDGTSRTHSWKLMAALPLVGIAELQRVAVIERRAPVRWGAAARSDCIGGHRPRGT